MPAGLHAAAVLALLLVVAMVRAEITSFCKCTCGPNSIILELTREGLSNLPLAQEPIDLDSLSPIACMNCTRALCSKANRDLCNDAGANEEITPLCFRKLLALQHTMNAAMASRPCVALPGKDMPF
ncbi:hypothetical protein EV182_000507 [Spiromyces aspiralis]|uniref:Uncharacterized protein n=1 Tax=Spiromyces aspiralis TaxID=68401 RepID=A0ACC1HKY6_9FUNG|nr:hypothetical protein EV182_000507 [Spiromyces aspiralis]